MVVLDTNVVLDLWLFADPRAVPLRSALQAGHLQALVTEPTLAELAHVLQRPFVQAWGAAAASVLPGLLASSRQVQPPPRQAPLPPRCSDADDQKFVDLAWGWPAAWLLSRDRAVLKLARAARSRGLRIGTPEAWAAAQQPG
jgi:predicted nucleic acid-binding protein